MPGKKLTGAFSLGSLGLGFFGAACSGACAAAVLPLGTLLSSMGLGFLSFWLTQLQLPFLLLAAAFGIYSLRKMIQEKLHWQAAAFGILLFSGMGFLSLRVVNSPQVSLKEFVGEAVAAPTVMADFELDAFKREFNSNVDKVRVVSLLSPACSYCVQGFRDLRSILKDNQSPELLLQIAWLPMVNGDNKQVAEKLTGSFLDDRKRESWDEANVLGKNVSRSLGLTRDAWDVYLVYPAGVTWNGKTIPEPEFWMHQLGKSYGVTRKNQLDKDRLAQRVESLTAALAG